MHLTVIYFCFFRKLLKLAEYGIIKGKDFAQMNELHSIQKMN